MYNTTLKVTHFFPQIHINYYWHHSRTYKGNCICTCMFMSIPRFNQGLHDVVRQHVRGACILTWTIRNSDRASLGCNVNKCSSWLIWNLRIVFTRKNNHVNSHIIVVICPDVTTTILINVTSILC